MSTLFTRSFPGAASVAHVVLLGLGTLAGVLGQSRRGRRRDDVAQIRSALPLAAPSPGREASHPAGQTVLVVDDEPAVRDVTMRALARAGYRVLGASSGGDALELLAVEQNPAAIVLLTDVMMPEMNGHELAEQVAARFPAVRTTSMSGFSSCEMARQGFAAASRPLLHKPFSLPQLIAFVDEAFATDSAVT